MLRPDGHIAPGTVIIDGDLITAVEPHRAPGASDFGHRLLAPGLIDVHGDAFERQIMPRPGVLVDLAAGLLDSDRQLAAAGITTAFHGLTWSWEPGLRGVATGLALIAATDRLRPRLLVDHRWHLRFEAHNLDGLEGALRLVGERAIDLLAFNDHTPAMAEAADRPTGNLGAAIRAGVPLAAFNDLARAAQGRAPEVAAGQERLAAAAREIGLPLLSHDDRTAARRARMRALGCRIAEFPLTAEAAKAAHAAGDPVVMGAPNAVRGRSHLDKLSAREAIAADWCTALASDYWYPSLLLAPYRLAAAGLTDLARGYALVTSGPATVANLTDRGAIAAGRRADLIVVEDDDAEAPAVVMTVVGGRAAWQAA